MKEPTEHPETIASTTSPETALPPSRTRDRHRRLPTGAITAVFLGIFAIQGDAAEAPYVNMYAPVLQASHSLGEVIISELLTPEGEIQRRSRLLIIPGIETPILAEHHYQRDGLPQGSTAGSPGPLATLDLPDAALIFATAMAGDRVILKTDGTVQIAGIVSKAVVGFHVGETLAPRTFTVYFPAAFGVRAAITLLQAIPGVEYAEPDFIGLPFAEPYESLQWHPVRISPTGSGLGVTGAGTVAIMDTGALVNHEDLVGKASSSSFDFVNNSATVTDTSGHGTHIAGIISSTYNNGVGVRGICPDVKFAALRIASTASTGESIVFYSKAVLAMTHVRTVNPGAGITVVNHSWGGNSFNQALYESINNGTVSNNSPVPADDTVRAAWTANSHILTITQQGTTEYRDRIKAGMLVTGANLPSGSRCLLVYSESGTGMPDRVMLSHKPSLAGNNVALRFESESRADQYGVMNIAAAGNLKRDLDQTPIFPACLPSRFVISVGGSASGTGAAETPTNFTTTSGSNYGKRSVDLFAPGMLIMSTYKNVSGSQSLGYENLSGTSQAAAQVSAAAAIIRIRNPAASPTAWRDAILASVDVPGDPNPNVPGGLNGKCVTHGRLNLDKAATMKNLATAE